MQALQSFFTQVSEALGSSIVSTGTGVIDILPRLIGAIIIFAIGWVVASIIENIIESVFKSMKVDGLLKSAGMDDVMKRTGHPLNSGLFIGSLIKWFVIVAFLLSSFEVLGLTRVTDFLKEVVLAYLPNVIVAVLILMVAVILAETMQKIVVASARAAHVKSAHLLGVLTRWAIWIFAILSVAIQLNIASGIIGMVVQGLVAGGALAFGLAFGLGGKEHASEIIGATLKKLEERE